MSWYVRQITPGSGLGLEIRKDLPGGFIAFAPNQFGKVRSMWRRGNVGSGEEMSMARTACAHARAASAAKRYGTRNSVARRCFYDLVAAEMNKLDMGEAA
jgi:hypothetical protein